MSRQPARRGPPQGGQYANLADPNPYQQQQQGSSPLNPSHQQGPPSSSHSNTSYDPPSARGRLDSDQGHLLNNAPSRARSGESNSSASDSSGGIGTTNGVVTGAIGGGYGPYSYTPLDPRAQQQQNLPPPSFNHHNNAANNRPESAASRAGSAIPASAGGGGPMRSAPVWTARDAEMDDRLHNAGPNDKFKDRSCTPFSTRGWLNMAALLFLVGGLITLFAGYPIIQYYGATAMPKYGAFNVGGINATGQVPLIKGLPTLIDASTPATALSRTGFDGQKYVLMFSDEFNVDARTFWPGDDPFWEAVDIHYWATGDYEWYDPDAVTTKGGSLVITIDEEPIHGLNFRSGMLQSWNKLCFTGGYIEVAITLPGSSLVSGFWPGAWTIGNLARAGYGATTDGTWPYSYNSCDVGTLKNQTNVAGTAPAAAVNSGSSDYGGTLSYQPGQRLSACTCKGGDHPGPNVGVGRGAPEIDLLEAQVSYEAGAFFGSVSQSAQFAPYDTGYEYLNVTPQTVIYNPAVTILNSYTGGIYQQACSAVTNTDPAAYTLGGGAFSKYGYEAWPDTTNGYITWSVGDLASWTLTSAAVGPNAATQVGQRLISQEPMSIVLNLGISASFQTINWAKLKLPATMLVDYVRVYQREDSPNMGCDPPTMPTSDYINNHLKAYMDPNATTWEAAGYTYPKNSLTGC